MCRIGALLFAAWTTVAAGADPLPALRAYTVGEQDLPEHQWRELVGDLVGGYFSIKRCRCSVSPVRIPACAVRSTSSTKC